MIMKTRTYELGVKEYQLKEYWDGRVVISVSGSIRPLPEDSDEYVSVVMHHKLEESNRAKIHATCSLGQPAF